MIQKNPSGKPAVSSGRKGASTTLTIFAIPKRFEGHIGIIQKNAIRSWARLAPGVEIILFGQGDAELTQLAAEVDATLVPLATNGGGTPLLSEAFRYVHNNADGSLYCYINSDIIFGPELLEVADELLQSQLTSFLAVGQRTSAPIETEIDFSNSGQVDQITQLVRRSGKRDSVVCKDFFLFTSDLFQTMPEFLVGRGNWDNWMVSSTKSSGTPVVDLTLRLTAIHQNHDYSHVAGGRKNAYVFGEEARTNQRLAGGRNLIYGSTPTWEMTQNGPKKRRFPIFSMLKDTPKLLTLLRNLLILGYLLAGTALTY